MKRYEFNLKISSHQYLDYYRGKARQVVVRSTCGQGVKFPASALQRFVTQDGIYGDFVLTCDDDHKNLRLERADPKV